MTIQATGNQGNYSAVTTSTSHVLTFGFTATAGNLLVVVCGSNQVIVVPSGWSVGTFVDNSREARIFWKIADGTETSVTISVTTGSWDLIATVREYSGIASTPLDRTATATGTSATVPTGTTPVTSRTEELCIGCWVGAGSGSYSGYTNSFTEFVDGVTSAAVGNDTTLAAAELITSTTGAKTSTATGSSSFAYSACIVTFFGADAPKSPVTPNFVCGAECGIAVVGTLSAGTEHWGSVSGTPSVVTSGPSPMRSTRCFRFNPSASSQSLVHTFAAAIGSPSTMVARFYIYFATLPNANCILFRTEASGLGLYFTSSDNSIRGGLAAGSQAASGIIVTTGQWYRVDMKAVVDTTRTCDFKVDGVAGTQYTVAGAAATTTAFTFGAGAGSVTADIYYDDIIVSGTAADYPIGEGTVAGLYPNADGTHGGGWATGVFGKGTSGATNASNTDTDIWQSLDQPLVATAAGTWVSDLTGVATTNYVEFRMDDIPAVTTVNGVQTVVTTHSATATASTIDIKLANAAGTTLAVLTTTDLSESTITIPVAVFATGYGGGAWTKTMVDETKVRFSSTDSNPDVFLDGVCIEVDYVTAAAFLEKPLVILQAIQRSAVS